MKKFKLTAFLIAATLILGGLSENILVVGATNSISVQNEELWMTTTEEEAAAREGAEEIIEETEEMTEDEGSDAIEEIDDFTVEKMAVVYLVDYYTVRREPTLFSEEVIKVPSGQTVQVEHCDIYEGEAWFRVRFYVNVVEYEGYIQEANLAYSDEELLQWKQENVVDDRAPEEIEVLGSNGTDKERLSADIAQFPASYHRQLMALKEQYPNWVFVKMNTGLKWEDVIWNELNPASRSLVPVSSPEGWKNGVYGQGWAYASERILEYYMDPRNFLNQREIFQFEQLTFNGSYHTQAAVQSFLNSTFMAGNAPDGSGSYASMFYNIGVELGVSPFHLASRVFQEQGVGKSPLISGTYAGYEGYYNYFNIGASGSTNQAVIKSGLARAKKEGWNTVYLSLYGGAKAISKDYILKGQDTLYLQKFDVDNQYSGMYWHQYMQNIGAPTSEAYSIYKSYDLTDSVNNTFVFKIPVYENMPANACGKPLRYDDVADNAWYYDYVSYVYTHSIMNGKGVNIFAPEDKLTRAELATILYGIAGKPDVEYQAIFADVPDGQWYTDAIIWANRAGIVSGYGSGTFGVSDLVTREQMVLMMKKFGMFEGRDMSGDNTALNAFADKSLVSSWAADAMNWAVHQGMISGKGSDIVPQGSTTRAEAATILYRYMVLKYADYGYAEFPRGNAVG